MRLIVARCEVVYSGRLSAVLPEAVRLLILKADGSVLVHDDAGGFKPLNWMTAPTFVTDEGDTLVVTKPKTEDQLEIRLVEVLSDVDARHGRVGRVAEGWRRAGPAARARGRARRARRAAHARQARVGDRDRAGRSDVQGRRRRVGRGRDQARRDDRGRRAVDAVPRVHPRGPGEGRAAAASSRRSSSSPRRWRSQSRAGSDVRQSTCRYSAASASPI